MCMYYLPIFCVKYKKKKNVNIEKSKTNTFDITYNHIHHGYVYEYAYISPQIRIHISHTVHKNLQMLTFGKQQSHRTGH